MLRCGSGGGDRASSRQLDARKEGLPWKMTAAAVGAAMDRSKRSAWCAVVVVAAVAPAAAPMLLSFAYAQLFPFEVCALAHNYQYCSQILQCCYSVGLMALPWQLALGQTKEWVQGVAVIESDEQFRWLRQVSTPCHSASVFDSARSGLLQMWTISAGYIAAYVVVLSWWLSLRDDDERFFVVAAAVEQLGLRNFDVDAGEEVASVYAAVLLTGRPQ